MKKTSLFTILTALPVMFLPMQMLAAWEFSANGNVLSAYGESGYTVESPLSITIAAPTDLQFDGNYKPATLSNTAAWTAAGLTVPTILYNGKEHAPSMLGTYTASISAGGATAEVVYTIKTVINYLSFFDGGLTQGKNYDVISGTGAYEVALNNSEHKGVYWNSEENCAVFDGEAYLQIDNPLGNVTPNSGLTITMDVWISSDNNGSGTFIRSTGVEAGKNGWQRLFDMSDGTTADCIFINAGDARNGRAHLMFCLRRGYETGQTEVENTSGNSFFNQWCTVTMVVAPGGYSTLYVNGALLTHSSSSDVSKIVSVLEHISEFNKCYIGTSIFEATGDNADGFFIGKIRGFQTAEGALMPYYDGVDYHYLLSYATNGGNPITGQFVATIPDNLPTPTHPNSNAVFLGWYTDEELTIPVTTGVALTRNTALYAKWEEYRLDSIRLGWQVKIGNASPINPTPYVTVNPTAADTMGYVMIPVGFEFVIIPSDEQKPLVSKLELIDKNPPLTLEAVENGTITFDNKASGQVKVSKIYENGGSIQYIDAGSTESIEVNAGDKVSFYGDNTTYATGPYDYSTISCTGDCYIYGNIMSLVSKDNFANSEYWTMGDRAFYQLFHNNTHIVNHPSKTLVLPATTLTQYCYRYMFKGCTSLTTAPELPATTLANSCYMEMFNGCTSLTTAPELPATTLVSNCYNRMFNGCTNLASVTCLATSGINTNSSTEYWLSGVAASGTFTKAAGISWPGGFNGIPSGWITIPVVPGAFSVSSTKKVYFSQGNLKYSNGTWSFHTNQYDRCFTSVGNVSSSYNASGTFDIFGWGTSGYDHGAVCYQPWSTNTTETNYNPYGSATANLYDSNGKADWGYNAISNGGNTENQWRTLTTEEWQYLFNNHTKGWSTINGVNGYVIRPDGVSTTVASSYTTSDWATQEAAGSVFLPAAGDRNGTTVYGVGSFGTYWSSTFYESDVKDACCMFFDSSDWGSGRYHRFLGNSVRLVRNAE